MPVENSASMDEKVMRPGLWLLVVIGIAGIIFFFAKFNESFPSASIDLKLSREQIAARSREWAERVGYKTDGTITSTIFSFADEEKIFLEYELGQSKANELMRSKLPIWYWVTRFCREKQIEEINLGVSPTGELDYFSWTIPNDKEMPVLTHAAAELKCREFVEKILGKSLKNTKLVKDSEDKQLRRTDHYFTWEDQSVSYAGGHLRTYVYVSGDVVTSYSSYLHVPEAFQRKYAEIRSYNDLLKQISSVVYVVLSSAISFVFIWAFASGRIRWKLAFAAGAVGSLMGVMSWIDAWPNVVARYSTTMTFQQYLTNSLVGVFFNAIFAAIASIVFIGALEPVYRMLFPEKARVESVFSVQGLRSVSVVRSLIAGLSVFGLHTAYVVAFYLIGQKLGFWSPLEIRETAILSGLLPAWSAIDVGIVASTTEELMYRILGLALFQKLTKNFWAANALQAIAWAFMHSDYPQEPAYVRGVELSIGGFFYGFILKQYGLPACILAHYTYDAFLGVTPLFSSHAAVDFIWALVAVSPGIIALLVAGYLIARKGLNRDEQSLANIAVEPPQKAVQAEEVAAVSFRYERLSSSVIGLLVCGAIVGGLVLALAHQRTVGDLDRVEASRSQALVAASEYLAKNGINTQGLMRSAYLTDDSDREQLQYVFEKSNFARTKELAKKVEPRLIWKVRFFKPMDPEEFVVTLGPDAKPRYHSRIEMEDAAGAKLEQPKARAMVETFLNGEHPEYHYVYDDSTRHERQARVDYDFTYRVPDMKVGEADFRVRTGVVGDDVSGFSRGWQIPDEWLFQRSVQTWYQQIFSIVRGSYMVLLALAMVWWVIGLIRARLINWKLPIYLAGLAGGAAVLALVNNAPVFFSGYDTQVGLNTYVMKELVSNLIYVLSTVASAGLFSAIAIAAFRQMFPQLPPMALFKAAFPWRVAVSNVTRNMWFDGLFGAYLYGICAAALFHLISVGESYTSPQIWLESVSGIRGMTDHLTISGGEFLSALQAGFGVLFTIVCIASITRKFSGGKLWRLVLFTVVTALVLASGEKYLPDFLWSVTSYCLLGLSFYVFVVKVARLNVVTYLLTGYAGALASSIIAIWEQGRVVYFPDLAVLVTALLAPVAYVIWLQLVKPVASADAVTPGSSNRSS